VLASRLNGWLETYFARLVLSRAGRAGLVGEWQPEYGKFLYRQAARQEYEYANVFSYGVAIICAFGEWISNLCGLNRCYLVVVRGGRNYPGRKAS
jgi:hypothetical protein